jgi:nicotinate-nucleotide adenylyltransferase
VVPAGLPWQRDTQANPRARLEMLRLALAPHLKNGQVEINDCELRRKGDSYAIETVREIKPMFPGSKLIWVIGSDAFGGISTWFQIEELAELIEFLVIDRPGSQIANPPSFIRWRSVAISAPDISATQVRENIRSDKSVAELLPSSVSQFIVENGLYGAA